MDTLNSKVVTKLSTSTDTIEHVFSASKPPLASGLTNRFEVVQRPIDINDSSASLDSGANAVVELLSITNEGKLLHVRPDTHSETGWVEQHINLPTERADRRSLEGDVIEINAFYQGRRIFALLHYQASGDEHTVLPMVFDEQAGWKELVVKGNAANALYRTSQTDVYRTPKGKHVFYGVSAAFDEPQFFIVFETDDGSLEAVYERRPNAEATYRLMPGGNEDEHACLRLDSDGTHLQKFEFEYDQEEDEYYMEWGSDIAHAELDFGALTAANVFTFPSSLGTQSLLVLDGDKQLHYVAAYTKGELRGRKLMGEGIAAPASIANVSLGRDENNKAIVFALSAGDSRLWALRQSGVDELGDMLFDDWVCLGNRATVIGTPRAMLDGAELFLVNAENRSLEHMRQDCDTTFWANTPLLTAAKAAESNETISTHAVEIEALNGQGGTVANAALEIRASYNTLMSVNGLGLQANATRWLPVNTDGMGRLSIYIPADGLLAPELTIRVKNTGLETKIDPASRVAERLRGKDPRITVDTPALRKAGLIPDKIGGAEANAIAEVMRHIGREADGKGTGATRRMRLNKEGGSLKKLDAYELKTDALISSLNTGPQGNMSILGDLFNLIKHAWDKLTEVIITVSKQALELVVNIGKQVVKIVVNTAKGIAKAAEAFFQSIAKLVGETAADFAVKLTKFVTTLFGWEDILITNEVLKLTVNKTLQGFHDSLDKDAVDWAKGKTNQLKESMNGLFDQFEKLIGPLDPTNTRAIVAGEPSGQTSAILGGLQQNRVAGNMVSNQLNRNTALMDKAITVKPSADDDPFNEFFKKLNDSYKQRMETETLAVFEHFQPTTSAELFNGGIVTLLKTLRPIMLFALDVGGELLVLALRSMARFFTLVSNILNTAIDLPILSGIYKALAGKSLTILDIMTLLVAVPMTIVYKLLNKLTAPFSQKQLTELRKRDDDWKGLFRVLAGMLQKDSKEGIEITREMKKSAEAFVGVMKKPAQVMGLFTAVSDFAYGHVMAGKHLVDSKELSGKSGTFLKIIAYLAKLIRFVVGIPGKLVLLAEVMVSLTGSMLNETTSSGKWPYLLSALAGIITVIGLGLTLLTLVAPIPSLILTVIIDVVEGVVLGLLSLYTIVALIHNGVVTGDGWATSAECLDQIGSWFSMLPGLFSFVPPLVPILDSAYGAGEILLAILLVTDVLSGYGSGAVGLAGGVIKLASQ